MTRVLASHARPWSVPMRDGPELPTIDLPSHLKRTLEAGHPWVYRDHVPREFAAETGAWVRVRAGSTVAYALWDADSPIGLRVFSRRRVPDADWVAAQVTRAWELRAPIRASRTSAYRWINGEGDGLPGIVVDLYGDFAVVVLYTESVAGLVPWLIAALESTQPLRGVVRVVGDELTVLAGRAPPSRLVVEENGIRLLAPLGVGQKTGLFLDQRDNRSFVEGIASGRRVLNLFAYTGGFSLAARRGGAASVTTVDSSPDALAGVRENHSLNGFDAADDELVEADAFEFLRAARKDSRMWELVVCDPPSFARSREQTAHAKGAYTKLHSLALSVVTPSGYYAAGSCTGQISSAVFKKTLAEAGRRAERLLRIVHDSGHACDHPVLAGHPEGRYLKFVVARSEPVA